MIHTDEKSQTYEWIKPAITGLLFTVIAIGAFVIYQSGWVHRQFGLGAKAPTSAPFVTPEPDIHDRSQLECLGQYIADNHAGSRILLITHPYNSMTKTNLDWMTANLNRGLASIATISETDWPREPANEAESEEVHYAPYLNLASEFDRLLDENPDCDVVISLIGLPYDYPKMKLWSQPIEEIPKLYLVNANIYNLRKALSKRYIRGVVSHRPDIKYTIPQVLPTDIETAFEEHYLLIAPNNLDQVATKYPKLFAPEQTEKNTRQ